MTSASSAVELEFVSGDQGFVEASALPGEVAQGRVRFELSVRNVSGQPVTLSNPYDGITYHLISESGSPVQIKAPPSSAKAHIARHPAARKPYLELIGADVGGTKQPGEAAAEPEEVLLAQDGTLRLSLAVHSSLERTSRAVLDHVPAGSYGLVVMVRLVATIDGKRHPVLLRTADNLPISVS